MQTTTKSIDEGSFKMAKRGHIPLRKLARKNHYSIYTKEQAEDGTLTYTKLSKMKLLDITHLLAKWSTVNTRSVTSIRTLKVSDYGNTWLVSKA